MYAYSESYLPVAMDCLGEAFDYAVRACNLGADQFAALFVASGMAAQFQRGCPQVLAGISGTELAMEVISRSGMTMAFPPAQVGYQNSPEYRCGRALAYYQWFTGESFRSLHSRLSVKELRRLYAQLRKTSDQETMDALHQLLADRQEPGNLARLRQRLGLSQQELADRAGVNVRALQQYERTDLSLQSASLGTAVSLANALGCRVEDLI